MSDQLRILLHNDNTDALEATLKAAETDVAVESCTSYEDAPEVIARFRPDIAYSVRFGGMKGFPKDAYLGPDGPRWIANGGVGVDHFGSWDPARVTITNAAGVAADMMAEYVMGGFLHFTLDVPGLQSDKSARRWQSRTVRPIKGKTLLIIGLGNTGQAIAARARAFGMRVIGTRAMPRETENVHEVHGADALPALQQQADFIAVCTPLIEETRGLLGAAQFGAMKQGAILADVSRGGVVDQAALADALRSGRLAGAVSDVFEQEPLPGDSPLWNIENLVISPHCSSVYDGWEKASFELFLENLARWRKGVPLVNIVDPARGY